MYACVAVNVDHADILICYHPKQDVYNDADSCNKLFAVSSPTILDSKHHLASLILSYPSANTFYTFILARLCYMLQTRSRGIVKINIQNRKS